MKLAGSRIVLTGASGGIGSTLAPALCAEGAQVLAIGRRAGALAELQSRCTRLPGRLLPLIADITRDDGRARIVAAAREAGAPNLLIHAAALGDFGLFEDSDAARREAMLQTNLLAPMALTQALLPQLRSHAEAAVVAIGSTFGSLAYPGFATYSASKFALRGFIEALGREQADTGLRALWIAPRATDTAFNSAAVNALNRELGTRTDSAHDAARQILAALRSGARRHQFGFPEKLFVWLNGAFPALVDRGLRQALPSVRRHARPAAPVSPPASLTTTGAHP